MALLTTALPLALLVAAFARTQSAALHKVSRRASEMTLGERKESTPNGPICKGRKPCGWAIYKDHTRIIDAFMTNMCSCPSWKACLKYEDDISLRAYVFMCRDTSEEDEEHFRYPY